MKWQALQGAMTLFDMFGLGAAITIFAIIGLRFLVHPRRKAALQISKVLLTEITLEGLFANEFLKAMDKHQPFEEFDSEDDFDCIDSTESLERSNEASRTHTPSRKPLPFKETNSPGRLRQIYVKYRPVRKFVEGRGLKGMVRNVASYLQTVGHWALVIGPYTYDIYEKNGSICVFVGEWEETPPGEEDRIKMKEVGKTVCTDEDIWKIALMVYIRMKREKYDIGFNNCQRFVRLFARRIAIPDQRSVIDVLITMQRVYRMLPASFFTSAYQYSRCAGRVCLDILREFFSSELLETAFEHIRRTAKISFRAAFFLLTAGLLFGFLNMVRELKGWDVVEDRSKYVELLERFGFKDAELQHICLRGAFKGPNGMKDFFRQVVSKRRLLEGV